MPNYIIASAPFDPNQIINAADSSAAAKKAGQFVAKGMEGDGNTSTFPVYMIQLNGPGTVEQYDVTATSSVTRVVTVTPHVGP